MASRRTTIILDPDSESAARELARHYECSVSEAIRLSVLEQRKHILGIDPERRRARVEILHRLFDLFEGHDPDEEVRRLKQEDEGF